MDGTTGSWFGSAGAKNGNITFSTAWPTVFADGSSGSPDTVTIYPDIC